MNYVVVDLEWNQAMSSKSSVFNKLPIHLRGEIIQIGAVKLREDMTPGEEFQVDVKPVYFRRMHYKVKKLTGFDKERLSHGELFPDAFAAFREWCGEEVTFLTWGYDDQGIMEQNIIIHDLDWDWIAGWVNLQLIYNVQTGGDKNQKALSTAMEHFEIEQTRVAHDALGDAFNTALVCSHMDMEQGLAQYAEAAQILANRTPKERNSPQEGPDPMAHAAFCGIASKGEAFASGEIAKPVCPVCAGEMSFRRWLNQGDQRYMNLGECPQCGKVLIRLKFKKAEDGSYCATRLIYAADDGMQNYYEAKLAQPRKRGSGRGRRKKSSK
jgi:inhibitor of KinA sporulation pathway (predicted exonuclease)